VVQAAASTGPETASRFSPFPALVGVVVLVVAFLLTFLSLVCDLSGPPCDHIGVLDVVELLGGLLQSPGRCRSDLGIVWWVGHIGHLSSHECVRSETTW
jgi:hypothetical protein